MRQDESGRWVSDNGRYLWSGSEWIDLQAPLSEALIQAPSSQATSSQAPAEPDTTDLDPVPAEGRHHRSRRSRRGLLFLTGLVVLLALGVGAVLLAGRSSNDKPGTAAPAPAARDAVPGNAPPEPADPQVLDEAQRRDRAQAALLHIVDLPGTTEERPSTPTDVFLPCHRPPLVPPTGSVLVGQAVSNADFTGYVGQTIVGFPTARQAADALAQVRQVVSDCGAYEYHYANSERVDRITHTDIDQNLALGDGGVYLVEVDTPANYAGTPTAYSYGYIQRGQFLVRLTLTNNSKADRPGLELLAQKTLDRLQ